MKLFSLGLFLTGVFYGLTVGMTWNDMVEFSQVMAGNVPYTEWNSFYLGRGKEITLLSVFPSFLFYIGLDAFTISVITSALTCGLAFLAWGLLAFVFSRSYLFSLMLPFLFLGYIYPNAHYYPQIFPIDFFIFGQIGSYLSFIFISFWALTREKTAAGVWGLLASIHPPWAAGTLSGVVIDQFRQRSQKLWPSVLIAIATVGLGIGLTYAGWVYIIKPVQPIPRSSQQQIEEVASKLNVDQYVTEIETRPVLPTDPQRRGMFQEHNGLFKTAKRPAKEVFNFFSSEILLLLLILFVWRHLPGMWSAPIKRIGFILLWIGMIASVVKLLEEVDPAHSWLGPIGSYLVRVIPNRWLNIHMTALPIFSYAVIFYLAAVRRWWPAVVLGLVVLLTPHKFQLLNYDEPAKFGRAWLAPWLVALLLLYYVFEIKRKWPQIGAWFVLPNRFARPAAGVVAVAAMIGVSARIYLESARQPGINQKDEFTEIADELRKSGPQFGIVLSGDVQGVRGFNVQSRAGRSYYILTYAAINYAPGKNLQVFCYYDPHQSYRDFVQHTKKCFRERKRSVWAFIGRIYQANQVLVTSDIDLDLPLRLSSGTLKIYDIPTVESLVENRQKARMAQ
ncbi:MAG: hypothetical protein AB7G93_07485 [Bdellovibrionales bacterium]